MIFISLSLQGLFPVGGPVFLFELTFPFNIYHSGLLKCCFSAEAACKLFVAAAFLEVCCLQCLIPHLNYPTLSFHLCTRPLHHKICFWESWGSSGLLPLVVSCLTLRECFQRAAAPLWAVCCECLGRGEPQPAVMFGLGADAGSSGTVCTPRTGPSASEFCTESLRALRTWTCVWDRGTSGK